MMNGLHHARSPPSVPPRAAARALVIQLTVFYFGLRLGLWATILVIGYLHRRSSSRRSCRPAADDMVIAFNGAIFLFVASC